MGEVVLAKYDRVLPDKRRDVINLYRAGASMARVARLTGVSETEVFNILHEAERAGNPVFLCNRLSVNLAKSHLSAKDYLDLMRAKKIADRDRIPTKDLLSQVRKVTELCYSMNINLQDLARSFNEFHKFVLSAPPEDLESNIIHWLKLFEDKTDKFEKRQKRIPWLRNKIELLERLPKRHGSSAVYDKGTLFDKATLSDKDTFSKLVAKYHNGTLVRYLSPLLNEIISIRKELGWSANYTEEKPS